MQYYTKQQIQGAGRYQPRVLIGNWNEDRTVEERVLRDFIDRKDAQNLRIDNFQAKLDVALAPTELTVKAEDGYVHFGDVIQLASADAKAVVAINTSEKDTRPGHHAFGCTGSDRHISPCARNTVIVSKYQSTSASSQEFSNDVVRYGQKLRLLAHPGCQDMPLDSGGGPSPLYLFSKPVSTTNYSKYSREQICGFTADRSFDTVFQVVCPDPAHRTASEGVEVRSAAPICLLHCATNALLCLRNHRHATDFGPEFELTFHTTHPQGKKLMLCHENRGELTATIPAAHLSPNMFVLLTGSKVAQLPPPPCAATAATAVLDRLRNGLARAPDRLETFRRRMVAMDASGSGRVPLEDVRLALGYVGMTIDDHELAALQALSASDRVTDLELRTILDHLHA